MPTRIARLGRERTVATLARRVYMLDAGDTEQQRRAEAALLAANPRLASKESFRSGAAIVVPAVRGLELSEIVARPASRESGIADETALRLESLASRIEDGARRGAEKRAEALEQLRDRNFLERTRRALPEATDVLKKATERLAGDGEAAKVEAERLAKAVDTALEQLKALRALGARTGPR